MIPDSEYAGLTLGGRYRLTAPLGAGGMAVVWRAHDEVLGRAVAVKMVAPGRVGDQRSRDRIRHEARAAATLSHPNVAHVHDYGEMDDAGRVIPYVVMELVSGGTLWRRLKAGPLAPAFAMRVGAEVAAALAAAHAEGLVHCDIKPANIMLAPTGAKVVDFGIAAAIDPTVTFDLSATVDFGSVEVLGTPTYLAPERKAGLPPAPASDLYALGVVLHMMFYGRTPSGVSGEPFVAGPVPGLPGHVVDLLDRCLDTDPARRPGAEEAAGVLARGAGLRVVTDEPYPVAAGADAVVEPTVLVRPAQRHRPVSGASIGGASVGGVPVSGAPVSGASVGGVPPRASVTGVPGGAPRSGPSFTPAPVSGAPVAGGPAASGGAAPSGQAPSGSGRRRMLAGVGAGLLMIAGVGGWLLLDGGSTTGREAVTRDGLAVAKPSAPAPAASSIPRSGTAKPATTTKSRGDTVPLGAARSPSPQPSVTAGSAAPTTPATTTTTTTKPAPTDPTATAPQPTTAAPRLEQRTLSSEAGVVEATCTTADTAQILSWKATKPYKVLSTDPGPSAVATVTYKRGGAELTMTVVCTGGVPELAVDTAA